LRTYEALYIVRPDIKDDEIQAVADSIQALVTEAGGTIVRSEIWGKRKLAYEVKHFTEGCYVLLRFESDAALAKRLENHFRISESVIRYLIVYFDEKTLRLEAEQQAKKEAEVAAGAAHRSRDDDGDRRGGRSDRRRRDDDDDDDEDD